MLVGEKVEKEWLREKTTLKQAEEENMVKDDSLGPEPIPFGFMNWVWQIFKLHLKEGDEIWKFSSSKKKWKNLTGRAGLCIVRGEEIVFSIVTKMN